MSLFGILSTILLSICSTAILSYISMAVMIGPWIESTVVLAAILLVGIFVGTSSSQWRIRTLGLITAGASVGGIMATGCGFAFPTLYFLQKDLFISWMSNPWYFCWVMAGVAFTAAGLGMVIANYCEDKVMSDDMPFPIGQLVYKMISAQEHAGQAVELAAGFVTSSIYSVLMYVYGPVSRMLTISIPVSRWTTIQRLSFPLIEFPLLLAIGFITGHMIAIPLGVGILAKLFIAAPLHAYSFKHLSYMEFTFGFAAGIMAYGALIGFLDFPQFIKSAYRTIKGMLSGHSNMVFRIASLETIVQWLVVVGSCIAYLSYFKFSLLSQFYLILMSGLCAYQLIIIGGKLGLAPVARFATFVMLPGMLLFGFNAIQITLLSTFVEVCGGTAVDILFGRKMARMADIPRRKIMLYQWLGIIVSALTVGIVFYLLITKLGLGSEHLLAQRAHTRALTVHIKSFDFFALICGALFGAVLKELKVSPIMVLGGILMPLEWSLILLVGGISTFLVQSTERYYPFWSGIFAASSLWMVFQGLL